MQGDSGKRTLAEVREVATRLRERMVDIDHVWQGHIGDSKRFSPSSIAASEANLSGYDEVVTDVLSFVDLLISAALDHANELVKWGEGAARSESTPVWSPWSVARSLVEVCAVIQWLVEVPLSQAERIARMLAISIRDSKTMTRIGQDETARIADAKAVADRLHLKIPAVKGHTALVTDLLSDLEKLNVYSMLSAASHGEPWAISAMGYEGEDDDRGDGTHLRRKKPSAFWLWSALAVATISLTTASTNARLYRGWKA